jgi:hypothetical protein
MAAPEQRPGIGIDSSGGQVIDPTKNVLDLVEAGRQAADKLRESDLRYIDAMRAAETRRIDQLREAETHRINELAAQKERYDIELAKILRANQDAASTLLATQLKEVKNDLADRTSKLEQFRWESGGKFSGAGSLFGYIVGIAGVLIALSAVIMHGR